MNRQIRQLGLVLSILFVVLFVQLNNIQVLQAAKLQDDPRNNRNAVRDFSSPRGDILSADGTILADSRPSSDMYGQQREYPQGELFGDLTGFFSFTYGNEGLERTYNDDLTGKTQSLKNIGDLLTSRTNTNNVTITVTQRMQQVAKDALGDKTGAVVALNPKTGEILAMYSNPSYDPNKLAGHNFSQVTADRAAMLKDPGNPMLPRAYRQSYPPGSTFKIVTSSAAYDKNPGLTTKSYPRLEQLALPNTNKTLANFGHESCGGRLPQLLQVSCNSGFGQMGLDLGAKNLTGEAQSFGFNQSPPLDLPATAKSKFPTDLTNTSPFLAYSAIGQSDVSATPLEMALSVGGIANGGVIMKPHLLKDVRDQHGDVVRSGKSQQWMRATSQQTAQSMTNNMLGVVNSGTGTAARIPGVQVAGKTGTAQTHGDYIDAWFVSFAPANDPQIAVAVIVENQIGVSESTGGLIAAPMAQMVMKTALGIQ